MQRLIARFLLLFALAGNFIPLALAATVAPAHACCFRKSAHQCHGSAGESAQLSIRSIGCCNQDCCHAIISSQWAHPQTPTLGTFAPTLSAHEIAARSSASPSEFCASQSARAPPHFSIA